MEKKIIELDGEKQEIEVKKKKTEEKIASKNTAFLTLKYRNHPIFLTT